MSEENDMKMLEARLAAVEAKVGSGQVELNTEGLISFPMFDVGMPPIVPIGGGGGMFEWDGKKRQIKGGGVMVGRKWIEVAASSEELEDGTYRIKVTLGTEGDTAEIEKGEGWEDPDGNESYLPLYTISEGKVTEDLRGPYVVPCWE